MIVYNSNHKKIILEDEPLSSGGEGAVYKIQTPSSFANKYCVKLYYEKKRTEDRRKKIEFMVKNPPQKIEWDGSKIGWPIDLVYINNSFAGFIMPLAYPNSKKLTILTGLTLSKRLDSSWEKYDRKLGKYSLVSRMKLIVNISIPIHLLHDTGIYVLQDFKPDNVLITHDGLITLCDMDSIQINNGSKSSFYGTAATLEYAPPEYTNLNIGTSTGQPVDVSWDNFTIAVVFYQLMFGIHPYAVTPVKLKDGESNEISINIALNLFPFGPNASQLAVIPPPHNNFKVVPKEMQTFFIKAFSDNVLARPHAKDWGQLIHKYISGAGEVKKLESKSNSIITPKTSPRRETKKSVSIPPSGSYVPPSSPNNTSSSNSYVIKIMRAIIIIIFIIMIVRLLLILFN